MMRPTAAEKQVGLQSALDQVVPLVYADPDRALEVLINLIDNAIKFTPPNGSVAVLASMVETDPAAVYISVSDTGRGIPKDSLPQVFERLYQDPDSVDDSRAGLGLGLFIAKEIVTLHGGRMWVASEPGAGSTFSFTLPLYSLSQLLLPMITYQDRLRESLVMVRLELTPLSKSLRGSWKETCEQCLERLRLCIYVDKDLVLPATGTSGPVETFFVVASTDMERVGILMDRIRDQIGSLPRLEGRRHSARNRREDSCTASRRLEDPGTASLGYRRLRHGSCSARSWEQTKFHRKGEPRECALKSPARNNP